MDKIKEDLIIGIQSKLTNIIWTKEELILCRLILAEKKLQLLMNVGRPELHLQVKKVETVIPPNLIVELGKI